MEISRLQKTSEEETDLIAGEWEHSAPWTDSPGVLKGRGRLLEILLPKNQIKPCEETSSRGPPSYSSVVRPFQTPLIASLRANLSYIVRKKSLKILKQK